MPIHSLEGLPLHTRSLTVSLSRTEGGGCRARGDVIDLRKNGFVPSSYDIQPAGIIHSMNIELELAAETLEIERVAVDQPFVAVEASAATEGECCRDPAPRLLDFVGDRLDAGFPKRLSAHFGGPLGCSHLLTLFQLMARTVPLAVRLETEREAEEETRPRAGEPWFRRSVFVDGHLRADDRIDVAVQLADVHSRPVADGEPFTKRLARAHEWKLRATVERKRFEIQNLSAGERERRFETVGSTDWILHDDFVSPLVGAPIIPGLAKRVFGLFEAPADAPPLEDALLQLAPGFIQIVAALMDDYFEQRARSGSGGGAAEPAVSSLGGNTNSCYMWREGSAINRAWRSGG